MKPLSIALATAILVTPPVLAQTQSTDFCKERFLRSTGTPKPTDYGMSKNGEFCDGLVYVSNNADGEVSLAGLHLGSVQQMTLVASSYFESLAANDGETLAIEQNSQIFVLGQGSNPESTYRFDSVLTQERPLVAYAEAENAHVLGLAVEDLAFAGWIESRDWGRVYVPISLAESTDRKALVAGVRIPNHAIQIDYRVLDVAGMAIIDEGFISGEMDAASVVRIPITQMQDGLNELQVDVLYFNGNSYETSFYFYN